MRKIRLYFLAGLLTTLILIICLVAFSLVIEWHLFSAIAFWGILVPMIACLSSKILNRGNPIVIALFGITIFYSFMFFMTYKHYASDYFTLMRYSLVSSILLVVIYYYYNKLYDRIFPPDSKKLTP